MKPRPLFFRTPLAASIASLLSVSSALAADGTWTNAAGGSWPTTTHWSGGAVATDTGAIADFSTLDLAADATVTLDGARTVGSLIFGDATTASHNWNLNTGTGGPLTLAVTSGSPMIQVVNQTATIGATVAGTQGLTKTGAGILTLSGANTFSGQLIVTAGTLKAGNAAALGGSGAGNETVVLGGATFDVNGQAITNTEIIQIAGTGVGGAGALVNTGGAQQNALNRVVLSADATVGGSGRFDIRTGTTPTLDLGGFTLTKVGTNSFHVVGTAVTNGNINISGGIFAIETTSTVLGGAGAGTLTIGAGGTLGLYGNAGTNVTRDIVSNGGAITNLGSGAVINSAISLGAGTTTALNGSIGAGTSLGGVISGSGALGKSGSDTFTLSGTAANTYSGGTTISAGILSLGTGGTGANTSSAAALGTGTVSIGTGGTLRLWIQNSTTFTVANNLSLSGGTVLSQDGVYNMGGTVSLTGASTFATTYDGKDLNFTNTVSGAGSVTVQGGGTTRLTGANTYTGSTTINGSRLVISNANATSGFILSNNGTLSLRSISLSASQNITGAGNLAKDNQFFGDSTIAGTNNNYTGSTTVNVSKLTLAAGGVINGTSGISISGANSAQLVNNGSITTSAAGSFTSNSSSGFTGATNDNGVFINHSGAALNIGTGGLAVGGAFVLNPGSTFTNAAGTLTVNANGLVTFGDTAHLNAINPAGITLNSGGSVVATGALGTVHGWINSGKIASASAGAIALAGNSSENLDFTGFNNLALASATNGSTYSGSITVGTNGYQFGGAAATNLKVSSALTGANALNKTGAGGLILTAANSYGGATTVNGGTLAIGGTGSINNTASVSIGAGTLATNSLNAIGAAGSTITRTAAGSAVVFGGSIDETTDRILRDTAGSTFTHNGTGRLTFSNNFTMPDSAIGITVNGGGATVMQGVSGNTSALLNFNKAGVGSLTVNGTLTPNGGNIRVQGGVLNFASTATTSGNALLTSGRTAGGIAQFATGSSIKTADSNTSGILGGWATFNNTDWAQTNGTGNAIGGFTAYTADTWAAGTNTDVSLAGANPASGATTHSLRFNAAGAKTLTLAGTNVLTSGGLLVTSAVGNNLTTITGGTLTAGALNASTDLIVHQHNTANALTVASTIANNGTGTTSFTKAGAGTVNFSTQKTYTGATNVLAGTLSLTGGGGATGVIRGTVNVAAGATLVGATADSLGYSTTSQVATLNLLGGTFDNAVNANQGYTTNVNLTGGAMTSSGGGRFNFDTGYGIASLASGTTSLVSTGIDIRSNSNLSVTVAPGYTTSGIDLDISGVVGNASGGSGSLTKNGGGVLQLSAANTYGGSTTVNAGTLQVANTAATNGRVTLNGGNLAITNGITYNVDGGLTFASNTSATVSAASGTASLRGFDVGSADVIVNTGISAVIAPTIGIATNSFGFRFDTNGTGSLSVAGAITGIGNANNAVNLTGQYTGTDSGALYKLGSGVLTLTGASTFTAGTNVAVTSVQDGTLRLSGGNDRLPGTSGVYLGATTTSGKLVLDGISQTITGLKTVGSGTANAVTGGSAILSTLTVNTTNDYTYSGVLGGAGANENNLAFTKSGAGQMTLTGTNTYTGATTVSAGTLAVSGSLANSAVTVQSGAGLLVSGVVGGSVNIDDGGTLSGNNSTFSSTVQINGIHQPGSSPGLQTFTAGLSYGASALLEVELVGNALGVRGTDFDGVDVTGGNLTIAPSATLDLNALSIDYALAIWDTDRSFTIIDFSGGGTSTGGFVLDTSNAGSFADEGAWSLGNASGDIVLNWTAVPEPASALLGSLASLILLRRRRPTT